MIPHQQQNDFKSAKEAIVLVKLDASPWYNTICPYCKHPVSSAWKFCADCGQAISFNNFSRIIRAGYKRINLTEEWKECVVDNNLCKDYFIRQLESLEADCLVETGKEFNEAREAYLKACFKG
jgi:hypothetical protein